ncbi:MAG: PQQ-binding-like beta-propeller repeat protein [Chloroflexi bacterium]|nr:PQQ-binding-like beta-propeller repeat protein [Chloroflexota bacterium]
MTFQPQKTGFYFTLDRTNGKFIAAKKFAKNVTIWSGVDPETGRLIENPGMRPVAGAPPMNVCPAIFGSRNWAHAAYNPKTNLVFLPGMEMCNRYSLAKEIEYKRGALYIGADFVAYSPEENAGVVRAIDPVNQRTVWEWWTRAPIQAGGTLATAGGLVFVGTQDGKLVALNQANGKPVWEFSLGAPVTGPPMSFAVNGKQHIAVITGGGKVTGDLLVGDDPKLQYLKSIPLGGTLTVFGLFE